MMMKKPMPDMSGMMGPEMMGSGGMMPPPAIPPRPVRTAAPSGMIAPPPTKPMPKKVAVAKKTAKKGNQRGR